MSTDFLDVLETQLDAAARRRYAGERRRAPRRLLGEVAVAAVAVAAVALAVVILGGGKEAADHSARTPVTPGATAPAGGVDGVRVVVLNGTTLAGAGRRVADQLAGAGADILRVTDDPDRQLQDTEVLYARGSGANALAVSQLLTDIPPQLAALRVHPLDASTRAVAGEADVVVRVGRDDLVTPHATSPVDLVAGCPSHANPPAAYSVQEAIDSVLLAWPERDGAVLAGAHLGATPREVEVACGSARALNPAYAVVVELVLTRREPDAAGARLYLSCDGTGWKVWRTILHRR